MNGRKPCPDHQKRFYAVGKMKSPDIHTYDIQDRYINQISSYYFLDHICYNILTFGIFPLILAARRDEYF